MTGSAQGNTFSAAAGRLNITVKYDGQAIESVCIDSTRPKSMARLLEGKTPAEAFHLIPLLFALCGTSQTVAAAIAIESLRGINIPSSVKTARSVLVYIETAKELCLRLSKDWLNDNNFIELTSFMAFYQTALKQLSFALCLQTETTHQGKVFNYTELLESLERFLMPVILFCDQSKISSQKSESLARLVEQLNQQFKGIELGEPSANLKVSAKYVSQILDSPNAQDFCASPTVEINGASQCAQTGVWVRNTDTLYINQAQRSGNHSVTLRFLAIVYELAMIPQRIRHLIDNEGEPLSSVLSEGLVQVSSARGELIHKVSLESADGYERINKYHIVAPTEWNFHPQGSLVSMLQGVIVSREVLPVLIDKLILAIDPCVAYDIKIEE